MKKWYWIVTSFLIFSFLVYKAVEKAIIIREFLKFKYETVEGVKVFVNDEYSLKNMFQPSHFFKNINGEVGFFNSDEESQLMIYHFFNSNIESLNDIKITVNETVENYDFKHSTSVEWGDPLIRAISISDTIHFNQILLQVKSENDVLKSAMDSNYLFVELNTNKVVIANEFLEKFIIVELEPERNTQFLFFLNGGTVYLIVGNDNLNLLKFAQHLS